MSEGGLVMPTCAAINFNNNNSNRMVATVPKRKFSFPAALHSPSLQAELANCNGVNVGPSLTVATARRRFSNVSDVVSRKLSHTIGWRTAVPTEQIARQGKYMCIQYIRWKLKRAGAYTKKCAGALRCAHAAVKTAAAMEMNATAADHLQHNSGYFIPPQAGGDTSVLGDELQNDSVPREVFPAVLRVGLQLERLDPKLYAANSHVCGVTGDGIVSPPSVATSLLQQRLEHRHPTFRWDEVAETTTAAVLLVSVSRELFRAGAQVTWAKIVSLLCLATRLAIDCARRGCAEQLPDLIEAVGEVIEDDLAAWIHYNGGWVYNIIQQNYIIN